MQTPQCVWEGKSPALAKQARLMCGSSLPAALQASSIRTAVDGSAGDAPDHNSKKNKGQRERKLENVMTSMCLHAPWHSCPSMSETACLPWRVPPSSQTVQNQVLQGHSKDVLVSQDIISLVTFVAMVDRRPTNSSVSIGVSCRHNEPEKQDPESNWCLAKNST